MRCRQSILCSEVAGGTQGATPAQQRVPWAAGRQTLQPSSVLEGKTAWPTSLWSNRALNTLVVSPFKGGTGQGPSLHQAVRGWAGPWGQRSRTDPRLKQEHSGLHPDSISVALFSVLFPHCSELKQRNLCRTWRNTFWESRCWIWCQSLR